MSFELFLTVALNGLTVSALYFIVAIGFSLIFGLMLLRDGAIMADSPPVQIITPPLIRTLYGVAVSTLTNAEGN